MLVARDKHDDDDRLPFDADDLRAIFTAPVHASGDRPRGGAGEAAYWFPVLGLMMGGRLQEIADLRVGDVRQSEEGVLARCRFRGHRDWVFHEGGGGLWDDAVLDDNSRLRRCV
jgi:hypothetical protein